MSSSQHIKKTSESITLIKISLASQRCSVIIFTH